MTVHEMTLGLRNADSIPSCAQQLSHAVVNRLYEHLLHYLYPEAFLSFKRKPGYRPWAM